MKDWEKVDKFLDKLKNELRDFSTDETFSNETKSRILYEARQDLTEKIPVLIRMVQDKKMQSLLYAKALKLLKEIKLTQVKLREKLN